MTWEGIWAIAGALCTRDEDGDPRTIVEGVYWIGRELHAIRHVLEGMEQTLAASITARAVRR